MAATELLTLTIAELAPKIRARINDAILSQHRPRVDHRVAPDLRPISDHRAKFRKPRGDLAIRRADMNLAMIELYVGQNHARAKMRAMPED